MSASGFKGAMLATFPIAVSLSLGLVACATSRLSVRPAPRAFTADDYDDVYRAWTRSADEFSFGRLADVLHVTATFESWEFRWAYVARYARDHSVTTDERAAMLRETLSDAKAHHRFFITLAGPRFRESDLAHDRSAWRVLLIDDRGHRTEPSEIVRLRRYGAQERHYFPSVSQQRTAARITFDAVDRNGSPTIDPTAERVTLRFAGAPGTVDLSWDLTPSGS